MIDKIVTHTIQGGVYKVISQLPNSRTQFKCKDIERGKGWDKYTKKYTGVKTKNGWYLGKNHCYGEVYTYHKKFLKEIKRNEED
jgi:hypothetical protein